MCRVASVGLTCACAQVELKNSTDTVDIDGPASNWWLWWPWPEDSIVPGMDYR